MLYEMLAGCSPFAGDTVSDVIAAILMRDPDWKRLPGNTPEFLHRLLRRALEKDPRQRAQDIGDVRLELDSASATAGSDSQPTRSIAVLPFTFLSEVEERQALSLGFADALITMLGDVEDIGAAYAAPFRRSRKPASR